MSWLASENELALRRGDPEAVASEAAAEQRRQRDVTERRQARERQNQEAQQQAAAEWARQRNEKQARLAAIRAELNHARAGVSNAQDLEAAKQAARDIGPLEMLEQQVDAALRSHESRMPAVGQML